MEAALPRDPSPRRTQYGQACASGRRGENPEPLKKRADSEMLPACFKHYGSQSEPLCSGQGLPVGGLWHRSEARLQALPGRQALPAWG